MKIVGKRDGGPGEKFPVRAFVFGGFGPGRSMDCAKVVVVDRPEKRIVCMPVSVGCGRKCCFCSSGGKPYSGPLSADDLRRMLNFALAEMPGRRAPLLVSMMGVGEPLDNPTSVVNFLGDLPDGTRKAIATTVPDIKLLGDVMNWLPDTKVLVSLHAGTHGMRRAVLRDSRCLSPRELFRELGDSVEYNYVAVRGLNDGEAEALALNGVAAGERMRLKLNALNRWPGMDHEPGDFPAHLLDFNIEVEEYQTDGGTVLGACGQCGC